MAVATDTLERIVLAALAEDVGQGDVTTDATVPADAIGTAELLVQERGVVCGLRAAETTFRALDPDLEFDVLVAEGKRDRASRAVALLSGSERAILTGERGRPQFLGRLSGIATLPTASTRSPGLERRSSTRARPPRPACTREAAVACGGGRNHRFGLDDGVLVKDNHLRATGSIAQAVESLRARPHFPSRWSATRSTRWPGACFGCGRDSLDNMSLDDLRSAVVLARGRATRSLRRNHVDNVRAVAETGVDETPSARSPIPHVP